MYGACCAGAWIACEKNPRDQAAHRRRLWRKAGSVMEDVAAHLTIATKRP